MSRSQNQKPKHLVVRNILSLTNPGPSACPRHAGKLKLSLLSKKKPSRIACPRENRMKDASTRIVQPRGGHQNHLRPQEPPSATRVRTGALAPGPWISAKEDQPNKVPYQGKVPPLL
ncbi:MAG: hypothetical protein BWY80_00557 [Firmicutes bacterium ADurb.Bin456]|nr:MAG: hypothetical protein BWY80_00557 [Firmicutes bacterium ADurb.Bin456]